MKRPRGRPQTTFTDEQVKQIGMLAGYGLKMTQIAALFDISIGNLEDVCKRDERIFSAIQKGRSQAAAAVTQTAYKLAVSGEVPAMTMFWLKCRQNWSEKTETIDPVNADDMNKFQAMPTKDLVSAAKGYIKLIESGTTIDAEASDQDKTIDHK